MRIIVGGYIGLYPTGGVTWDYIQYPLGLKMLGHDVYYIEDTMQYSRYQSTGQSWDDPTNSIQYLKTTMEKFGLADKWAYRDVATGKCFGLSIDKVKEICNSADVFINISAATYPRDEYLKIPIKVLIDSDPMFTQTQYWNEGNSEKSKMDIKQVFSWYNYLFTFGENIGQEDCVIPTFDMEWLPTRQPICIDYWPIGLDSGGRYGFTTVMNWSVRDKLHYNNQLWGQKDVEFEKFYNIPKLFSNIKFQIIVANSSITSKDFDYKKIGEAGWEIFSPLKTIKNYNDYRTFITSSTGEFSIAKETYVKSNSGWFSCRSACYLATGRPVIAQETKWSKYIPSGSGLFAFYDNDSALEALSEVTGNFEKNSKAARNIANEYFNSDKVLSKLIEEIR